MRLNARKSKSNPGNERRPSIRSSSIREIIGDRRFNDQFSRQNTQETEGIKKVKSTKVGEPDVHELPNLGRNASSIQCEATENQRCGYEDFAAKTSEYAFFKRIKENTSSNVQVHPKYHDNQPYNQPYNVQQSDHFTREEVPNAQKENIKYSASSLPIEEEQNDTHYSFLSPPCCGSKNSVVNNISGNDASNIQYIRPGEYNWLSPSVRSKMKNSGNEGVFSVKREKLRHLATNKSLYNVNELSSKGFDMVSSLISRILPRNQEDNKDTDSRYATLPSFSKGHENYKRKVTESRHISYLDLDDGFYIPRSTKRLIDMDLMEWNPTCSESPFAPKSSIQYNHCHTKPYNRKLIESPHTQGGYRFPNFNEPFPSCEPTNFDELVEPVFHNGPKLLEPPQSFNEPFPSCEPTNFDELVEPGFPNGPKLLEPPQSHTLLLGWENNHEKDDESFLTSSTSQYNDYQLFMPNLPTYSPPISPYINNRHLRQEHSLFSPYTPKHLMAVEEDCRINFRPQEYKTWCMNESLNEKEHKSFLYLIESPANNFLRVLDTSLHSFVVDDENEEDFVYSSDKLSEGLDRVKDYRYMEAFNDRPLLLYDSNRNDEL